MNAIAQWLLTPISGSAQHEIAPWAFWHARLMVLAWAILLPLGVLAARFFKILPGQDWPAVRDCRAWWHAHRALQYGGTALMLAGLALVWGRSGATSPLALWHGRIGVGVLLLGLAQLLSAWLRGSMGGPSDKRLRGDHYDMTPWRVAFERVHKAGGYAALLLAGVAIALGLLLADAPRWMALALTLWSLALVAAFALLQAQGRCIDTYQAIWGPETQTAASRQRPVGWGVKRYTAAQWRQKFGPAKARAQE